jgi:pimeloyl-ACP methyl ester carboxylesterase
MDTRLDSSDGVSLAFHRYPTSGSQGAGPVFLFSHANGFHGRTFDPVAKILAPRPSCTFDHRGHGDSTLPIDWQVRWSAYGDDALMAARATGDRGSVIGVGHSMGAASLVMAALQDQGLFRALVLYEPIIFPAEYRSHTTNPLAAAARRRRATFDSFDQAYANFASKAPLNAFHPDALRAYVDHGFRPLEDGRVGLKCSPEHEARTFESGNVHETWDQLGGLTVPTWLVSGRIDDIPPASLIPSLASTIAERSPVIATVIEWRDLGHFGPLEDPHRFASLLIEVSESLQ